MPVQVAMEAGRHGYRWGERGKVFIYTPNDEESRKRAHALAAEQGRAIIAAQTRSGRMDAAPKAIHVQFPTAIEAAYKRRLRSRLHAAHLLLLGQLAPLLAARRKAETARAKEARADADEPSIADFLRVFEEVRVALDAAMPVPEGAVYATARQLDLFTTAETARLVKAVAAIDIGSTAELVDLYQAWTADNVALITSIDAQHFGEIRDSVLDAVRTGRMTDDLASEIQERYSVSRSRAELIARDQVGKLNGQVTMRRQVGVGVTKYTWMTSNDERVRPSHRALNGKVFEWSKPPPEGHPGFPIQCRCSAIPIWEEEDAAFAVPSSP